MGLLNNNTGYILVIDEHLSKVEIESIRNTFYSYITNNENLNDSHTIIFGLITFSSTVSIYQIGLSGIASANVYNPNSSNSLSLLLQYDLKERSFLGYNSDGCRTIYQCLTALCSNSTNSTSSSTKTTTTENGNDDTHKNYSSRKEYL